MVKFSVFTLAFPGYTAEEAIRTAAKIGYDGVDIRVRHDGHIYIDSSKKERKQLLELANSLGIEFFGIYSYLGRRFTTHDSKEREKVLREAIAHLDLAVDLESVYLRIFPGTSERTKENMDRFVSVCKLVCKEAEDRGLYVGIETHGELVWNGDTCNLVLEEVGSDALRIVYDVGNIFRQGCDPLEELRKIDLSKVIAVQFHDFKREDKAWKSVLLGRGDVPHDPVIEYLKEKKYEGFIVDEYEKWWHPELPDPMEGLPYELNYLKRKFGRA
ncbi:MAG: sugar phosphate isomerase/epimerase [Thermoprotei archaeon]|nr:sugar phosphate isomerase/epimerase [Thermoprotei archaeon]